MKRNIFCRLTVIILILCPVGRAGAYTVDTGFSDPCHEIMTASAFQDFLFDLPLDDIEAPPGEAWRKLADLFIPYFSVDPASVSDAERFLLVSLIVGARSPDTDGHSVMNLAALREIHSDPSPEGQYAHALRTSSDDWAEGNASAVAGTRAMILSLTDDAEYYLYRPPNEQIITVPFYFEFSGVVDIYAWAPFYYMGRALHAVQDTFSHTIRSDADDLKMIVHVLNYIDAISEGFNENRDGLAHSDSMDKCIDPRAADLFESAKEASRDYVVAVRDKFKGYNPAAVDEFLDKWIVLKPGCTIEDNFCGNERWVQLVREEQTEPYLKKIFGCTVSGRETVDPADLLVPALLMLIFCLTRRRRRNPD